MSLELKNKIKERSILLTQIRSFFAKKNILEVETPLIDQAAATDPFLDPVKLHNNCYLQTSPEYAMKRLLSQGSGSIYQVCKAFRGSEKSKLHNPEFTMLEWYEVGVNFEEIIDSTFDLLKNILEPKISNTLKINNQYINNKNNIYNTKKIEYKNIFMENFDINPLDCELKDLENLLTINNIELYYNSNLDNPDLDNPNFDNSDFNNSDLKLTKADCFDLLFSYIIQPKLIEKNTIYAIYDFPIEQAALAKIKKVGNYFSASRFEIFINGIELANGYHELQDPKEQLNRFKQDLEIRKKINKELIPIDYNLIKSLEKGLPDCSGVALGIDRLLMAKLKLSSIEEVILC